MASKAAQNRAAGSGKDAPAGAGTPNQTLYLTNLPEKINKSELKRALYMLFSTYGPVLDIVTRRMSMRGQAHVVYRDIQTSTQAMRALQGFDFFGKEIKIVYAKGQSQIVNKLRGNFQMPAAAQIASEATDLQKSIFDAPPSSATAKPAEMNGVRPTDSLPPKPTQGTKRAREDEVEETSEVAEDDDDDDDDVSMEASSDED